MIRFVVDRFADMILAILRLIWPSIDQFRNPGWLLLLLLVPAYLIWYFWWYDNRRLVVKISYDPNKIAPNRMKLGFLRFIPMILNLLVMALFTVALARPITAKQVEQKFSEGIDIMLLLDTSGSMESQDFKPNRLEVAKKTANEFIDGRQFDRIGMVVFAEDAFSYAPLTLDYKLLKQQIKAISPNIMPKEGTAMGSAIAVSINRLRESSTPSKIMILISDGESNRGQIDPITAANLAERHKIKIYTIGIGKEEYQMQTMMGTQTVKSDLDEETMQEVAKITGGEFFRSTDEGSLERIFDKISQMEKVEIEESNFREENDVYPSILIAGFILFCINSLLMISFIHNPLEG